MDVSELSDFQLWVDSYYAPGDQRIEGLGGLNEFGSAEIEIVIDWKFNGQRHRYATTMKYLKQYEDRTLREVTSTAFRSEDDQRALETLCELKGVGPAVGTAILTAQDPIRWTVYDVNSVAALRLMGYHAAFENDFQAYLGACRELRNHFRLSLRDVDRGLFRLGQLVNWAEKRGLGNLLSRLLSPNDPSPQVG
jgi:hypothetical protein